MVISVQVIVHHAIKADFTSLVMLNVVALYLVVTCATFLAQTSVRHALSHVRTTVTTAGVTGDVGSPVHLAWKIISGGAGITNAEKNVVKCVIDLAVMNHVINCCLSANILVSVFVEKNAHSGVGSVSLSK